MSGWDNRYDVDAWNADLALTATQIALRDGTAAAPPCEGAARQRRITQMQADIAWCQDFVADCDRYRDALNAYPDPCLTPLVPKLMGRHLDQLRQHAVATGRRLRDELAVLRGGT